MSEFKGTKGNWRADKRDVFSDNLINSEFIEGNIICYAPEDSKISIQYWSANAKLISCAPEMLEALKNITNYLEDTLNEHGCESLERRTAICLSHELIKKATTI